MDFRNFVPSNSGATYSYTDDSTNRPPLSAVGLLSRTYLGWRKDSPALEDGVARLAKVCATENQAIMTIRSKIQRSNRSGWR